MFNYGKLEYQLPSNQDLNYNKVEMCWLDRKNQIKSMPDIEIPEGDFGDSIFEKRIDSISCMPTLAKDNKNNKKKVRLNMGFFTLNDRKELNKDFIFSKRTNIISSKGSILKKKGRSSIIEEEILSSEDIRLNLKDDIGSRSKRSYKRETKLEARYKESHKGKSLQKLK